MRCTHTSSFLSAVARFGAIVRADQRRRRTSHMSRRKGLIRLCVTTLGLNGHIPSSCYLTLHVDWTLQSCTFCRIALSLLRWTGSQPLKDASLLIRCECLFNNRFYNYRNMCIQRPASASSLFVAHSTSGTGPPYLVWRPARSLTETDRVEPWY